MGSELPSSCPYLDEGFPLIDAQNIFGWRMSRSYKRIQGTTGFEETLSEPDRLYNLDCFFDP
jgi:hypothetical protein